MGWFTALVYPLCHIHLTSLALPSVCFHQWITTDLFVTAYETHSSHLCQATTWSSHNGPFPNEVAQRHFSNTLRWCGRTPVCTSRLPYVLCLTMELAVTSPSTVIGRNASEVQRRWSHDILTLAVSCGCIQQVICLSLFSNMIPINLVIQCISTCCQQAFIELMALLWSHTTAAG